MTQTRTKLTCFAFAFAAPLVALAQNVAVVNGKPVPQARLDVMMKGAPGDDAKSRAPDPDRRLRDELVLREIYAQEAERRGLQKNPQVQAQIENSRQAYLIQALFEDFARKHPISDAEVRAEYDRRAGTAPGKKAYLVRHILVDKADQAKSLIAQIQGGARFEDLAAKYSRDTGSAKQGGEIEWSTLDDFVPEFAQAVAKLDKGRVPAEPVHTQFGYHVLRVDGVRGPMPPFDEMKARLRQGLMDEKLARYLADLRAKAKTNYTFAQ